GTLPDAAPADGSGGGEAARDGVERQLEGHADGGRGQRVGHVVAAGEGHADGLAPAARLQRERESRVRVRRLADDPPGAGGGTSQRVASTAAVSSLAVVLPMEPVMATTGTENLERCQAASRPRARVVSSTRTSGTLAGGSSGSVWTTTQAAPRAAASARKAWP